MATQHATRNTGSSAERLAAARAVADEARGVFGDLLLAVGARPPERGPGLLCVLDSDDDDYVYDWPHGRWRVAVACRSHSTLLWQAGTVDVEWPLVCGELREITPLHDPRGIFAELQELLRTRPPEAFTAAVHGVAQGLDETITKVREAWLAGETRRLPHLAAAMARQGALMLALAHRRAYEVEARLLADSLTLPDRPAGYDALCRIVMGRDFRDPARVAEACEAFRRGVDRWMGE